MNPKLPTVKKNANVQKLEPKNIPPYTVLLLKDSQCQKNSGLFSFLYTFYLTLKITLYSSSWHSKMFPCLRFQSFAKDSKS